MTVPLARTVFAGLFTVLGWAAGSPDHPMAGMATAAAIALLAIAVESRLSRIPSSRLLMGAAGAFAGVAAFALLTPALLHAGNLWALGAALVLLVYFGIAVGSRQQGGEPASGLAGGSGGWQLLMCDTSAIIDGRVADIAETGFLDSTLIVPQFVLRELQLVADSPDGQKRVRGRRGLDILKALQSNGNVRVEITDQDFASVREVDMKLIELAKLRNAKILTTDFNLNKVAQVRGVKVLNINELANSLRPVVLPGEMMRVFIAREGREPNQGVAYLEDGTMVVVDNARRLISKTIDITVTSVLQTTAGKMIFGKFDERVHVTHDRAREASAVPAVDAS